MSFSKYQKYKDTGLNWLGAVPEHWSVIAPKRVMQSCSGGTLIKGECAAEPGDGLFPAFSASGQDVWVERPDYSSPGIVLSAVGARCGKTFKADGEWGVVANTHCLFPDSNQNRDFFWYLTNREDWWETGGTAQPFVKVKETLARSWCLPPAREQKSIANFLDRETAKIDALIAEQQRLIELLQEKRQAVISHAVTKGLNPNAPMKDSGVEWLGEVPEHWEVGQLRRFAKAVKTGRTPDESDFMEPESGIPWFTPGSFNESSLALDAAKHVSVESLNEGRANLFPGNAVLVVGIGATLGKVGVPSEECSGNQQINAIEPSEKLEQRFLALFLAAAQEQMRISSNASTLGIMNQQKTKELVVNCPPLAEQRKIIDYADKVIAKIIDGHLEN